MLPQEKINIYKSRLEKLKAELLAELERKEVPEDFGSDIDGLDEEANEAEALGNQLAENQSLRERINEVDAALNRIEIGAYGLCGKCKQVIDEKMLDVVPESALCANCKRSEA